MTAKLKAICLSFIFILVALFPLGITQNAIAADGYEIEGTVVCTGSTAEYRIPVAGFEIGEVAKTEKAAAGSCKSGVNGNILTFVAAISVAGAGVLIIKKRRKTNDR